MKRETGTTALYAVSHFAVDFSCAALLFGRVFAADSWQWAALIYNFCAFALQMPFGLLADRLNKNRLVAVLGCALVALAYLPLPTAALCVAAGVGNALFHVGGGLDVLNLADKRAGPLGVFVAPGAFGIFFGAMLGKAGLAVWAPLSAMALCGAAMLMWCRAPKNVPFSFAQVSPRLVVLGLVLVVIARSFAGFLFSFPWKNGLWAVGFTAAVVLGKALGGVLADRFGRTVTALGSLAGAAILFLFSQYPLCGVLAVGLFNMTMPLTLRLAADAFPGAKGFSFGLLTFGLFLGFVPMWLGLAPTGSAGLYAAACLISAVLLLPALRVKESL